MLEVIDYFTNESYSFSFLRLLSVTNHASELVICVINHYGIIPCFQSIFASFIFFYEVWIQKIDSNLELS